MNYTENYHLPQWVKSDRIMMEDFNDAMEQLEAGLTGSAQASEDLRRSGRKTMDRLCRLAYNHYCAVQDLSPVPCQLGIFHQNAVKDLTGITGTLNWTGGQFAGKTDVTLNHEILSECFQQLTPMHFQTVGQRVSQPLTAAFCSPATGSAGLLSLYGSVDYVPEAFTAKFRMTLINQDTGGVERISDVSLPFPKGPGVFSNYISPDFTFLGGVNYLFKLEPVGLTCNMEANIAISANASINTHQNEGVVTAARTLHTPGGGQGGMAILRCQVTGEGGELTFRWDGVERQPDIVRLAKTTDGWGWQEYIYLREDEIPEDSTFSLEFECNMNGSFLFRDWGAVLF